MPPQSRGFSPTSFDPPPTLASFLDNLPSPASTTSDQRTPTGPRPNVVASDHAPPSSPTPRTQRTYSNEIDQDDEDDVTPDDAEFQSHYSRQSSPASTSSSDVSDTLNGVPHTTSPSTSPTAHLRHLHSEQSFPPPPPLPLYPPYYNRPPTNSLPPSPSLTSLLRPPSLLNRSTTSTRPTTPDSSDPETPNDTEAAVAQSARRATVVERVSPKVPTYEYYGFVLYLASSLAFLLYLLWSYLPSPFLHAIGIHYYPNRWWSLAIPAFIVMFLVYIYVALLSYNVEYLTLPMASLECMVDETANIAVLDSKGRIRRGGSKNINSANGNGGWARGNGLNGLNGMTTGYGRGRPERVNWRSVWNEGTDAVMDVPIGGVCEVLYGEGG